MVFPVSTNATLASGYKAPVGPPVTWNIKLGDTKTFKVVLDIGYQPFKMTNGTLITINVTQISHTPIGGQYYTYLITTSDNTSNLITNYNPKNGNIPFIYFIESLNTGYNTTTNGNIITIKSDVNSGGEFQENIIAKFDKNSGWLQYYSLIWHWKVFNETQKVIVKAFSSSNNGLPSMTVLSVIPTLGVIAIITFFNKKYRK